MFVKEVIIIILIKISVGVVVWFGIMVISGENRLFNVNSIVIIIEVKLVCLLVLILVVDLI